MDSAIPIPIPFRARTGPLPVAGYRPSSAAVALSRPQALILDDCRFIAERIARTLEAKGFECTFAADGLAGLGLVRFRRFDLVVVDVDMPIVDGFALLRALRSDPIHAATPVLMLASEHSETDRSEAMALGASGYMSKPLQLRPLNAMLDSLVL
jgi:DNA-binding response OmpR family regulator